MKVTTVGIIKMLPFEKQFQLKLLDDYENNRLSPDQKFAIEQIVWDTYEAFYKLKLQENLQEALLKVKTHQEKLDKGLYIRAKQLTERQMENDFSLYMTNTDISKVRAKLESLINKDNTSPSFAKAQDKPPDPTQDKPLPPSSLTSSGQS